MSTTIAHGVALLSVLAAAPTEAPAEAPRTRLAIMNLATAGVPVEYAVGLTETLATSIARTDVFETISPKQVSSLLAYEKRKDALGGCVQEACYAQIAQVVKADHLVAGSVAKVGEQLVLNLVLIDAKQGSAAARTNRQTPDATTLMKEVTGAAIALLQPLLGQRQGYLRVATNVPDADLLIDDELRASGPGRVVALAAGPHVVRVKRDGFYSASTSVMVRPEHVTVARVTLIPAKETIEAYETKANLMRWSAYGTGAVAVGAAVLGAVFYGMATDEKAIVDRHANALQVERAQPGAREEAIAANDRFATDQGVYLASLGTAVVAGAASLYLFISGDDPDRYAEFEGLEP